MQPQNKPLIRAVDFLPKPPKTAEGQSDDLSAVSDSLSLRLFGTQPDYQQDDYEKLWQEVFNADEQLMVDYCRQRGIDILDDDKVPVSGWRDVAVMLKAIDAGLINLA